MAKPTPQPSTVLWASLLRAYEKALKSLFRGVPVTVQGLTTLAESEWFQGMSYKIALAMVARAEKGNAKSWREAARQTRHSKRIYEALKKELETTIVGATVRASVEENAKLIRSLPLDIAQQITAFSEKQYERGGRTPDIEKEIRKKAPHLAKSRVQLIARTEISKVETALTKARSEDLDIPWYVWTTAEDQRTRKSHAKMNGVLVRWTDPPQPELLVGEPTQGRYHAGCIYNCFVGDTLVSSPEKVERLWKAPYSGDLVSLDFGGSILRVTPNHPLLTRSGWKAAKSLEVGEHLLSIGADYARGFEPNPHDRVTTFEEMFAAMSGHAREDIVHPSAFNFYGDIASDHVHQVVTDSNLLFNDYPKALQPLCEFLLAVADCWVFPADISSLLQIASAGFPGFFDQDFSAFNRSLSHAGIHGFGTAPMVNSLLFEDSVYSGAGDPQVFGNGQNALPSNVLSHHRFYRQHQFVGGSNTRSTLPDWNPQRMEMSTKAVWRDSEFLGGGSQGDPRFHETSCLLDKNVTHFSGHVYTLQSKVGWYGVTPNNIVARNCRCAALPLVDMEEIRWPAKVYYNGSITTMSAAKFRGLVVGKAA